MNRILFVFICCLFFSCDSGKDEFLLLLGLTWGANFKWKPPDDNTIDFLIKFDQDEVVKQGNRAITTNKIKRVLKEVGGVSSYDTYIVANLYSGGYIENKNPCFPNNSYNNKVLRPVETSLSVSRDDGLY